MSGDELTAATSRDSCGRRTVAPGPIRIRQQGRLPGEQGGMGRFSGRTAAETWTMCNCREGWMHRWWNEVMDELGCICLRVLAQTSSKPYKTKREGEGFKAGGGTACRPGQKHSLHCPVDQIWHA
eukprot:364409-Chlamydomonas_euryale.AAC.20